MAAETSQDPTVIASVASIALAWYYFYVRGDRERGIFVGLWAPTILSLSNYLSVRETRRQVRALTNPTRNIRESVQKMIGNQ
jgi:hypothetical protein